MDGIVLQERNRIIVPRAPIAVLDGLDAISVARDDRIGLNVVVLVGNYVNVLNYLAEVVFRHSMAKNIVHNERSKEMEDN